MSQPIKEIERTPSLEIIPQEDRLEDYEIDAASF